MPADATLSRWRRRALATMIVLVAAAVASQAGLGLALEYGNPRWRDPEYGHRLAYPPEPDRPGTDWRAARLAPWFAHRFILVGRTVPDWLPWYKRADFIWRGIDGHGWLPATFGPTDARSRRLGLANHYAYYGPVFR